METKIQIKRGGTGVGSVSEITGLLNNFVGDSGSGGIKGMVPAPAAGDAAADKFLKSDGTWSLIPIPEGDTTIPDGDKGDITVSSNGSVWTVDNKAITLSKIANASASSIILGSGDTGSGTAYVELALGTGLSISGTTLNASGDVIGPASATDNAIARYDTTTGKLLQNSGATVDDSGNITANNLSGTNTGDQDLSGLMVKSNNLSDVVDAGTARTNLGLEIGVDVQAFDANTAKLDVAQTFTKAQGTASVALTSTSNAVAVDASLSNKFTHVLTEDTTISAPSNLVDGRSYTFIFKQDATARTLAFDVAFKFIDDANFTIPSSADSLLIVSADYTTVGGLICATAIITV